MNNTPFTPSTIGSITFRIPLYQRPYAWEEPQVRQLLNDLYEAFKKHRGDHYYIGILSVAKTSDDEARVDLIDGQQRITALMLIGKAARRHCPDWDEFLTPSCNPGRLDLYGRTGDKAYLHDESKTGGCNPKMLESVRVAKEFFDKPGNDPEFARYIYEHAAFFLAKVPDGYSPMDKNQQFVRMNNRGKQLEKYEILKVRLPKFIADPAAREKAFKAWNEMVSCLTGIGAETDGPTKDLKSILDEDSGNDATQDGKETFYTSIVTIPEFLLIALARYYPEHGNTTKFFDTDKLLETFSALESDAAAIEAFMIDLTKQVTLLKSFFIFVSKGGGYELGMTQPEMTDKHEESFFDFGEGSNGKKCLIAVQSFLHVSTAPHHWLIPAFRWCSEFLGKKVDAEQFVRKLEEIDNALIRDGVRPKLYELKDMNYGSISYYWFYRLDYELWKRFHGQQKDGVWNSLPGDEGVNKLVQDFRFRSCGSVEHIIPQTRLDAASNVPPDHSFGNLALISGSRNSMFSNQPLEGKKDMILHSTAKPYTESLKMLHFLWYDPDVQHGGEAMYKILMEAVKGHLPPA
jgi:hypothetical protein